MEARDRGPCVWGGRGASEGGWEEESPPIPAVLLAVIQKGPFSASVRAAQLGREGRREGWPASSPVGLGSLGVGLEL